MTKEITWLHMICQISVQSSEVEHSYMKSCPVFEKRTKLKFNFQYALQALQQQWFQWLHANGRNSRSTTSAPKVPTIPAPISTSSPRHYVSIHLIYTILKHHYKH